MVPNDDDDRWNIIINVCLRLVFSLYRKYEDGTLTHEEYYKQITEFTNEQLPYYLKIDDFINEVV
jgi:hypothetical protein